MRIEPAAFKKTKDELTELIALFESGNRVISTGITLGDINYEVHRYFEEMIVGRKAEEAEGEGIALIKVPVKSAATNTDSGQSIYMLATYKLPTLSSKIIPMMKEYCAEYTV
ncbi:hypothetical protein PPL_09316 [Heterostelium album PN500]|uniref:Uncharacterized protein n=1 Tax=Heterostelium pallidum (strain ATCC 26659 / Pp 5 / PN500) TaxID=670386 RepID=D3BL84_HETP5|nr:hypothetical protein PPL_09316 [Heterostelium album PN500]EFA77818.1 hypothetical protein PPL_09316 [Heterostelium album PN500]|eukprot:XP_020429946.1 hypothetical protein PPL_09316 [Heterostelium album PN500]